MCLELRGQANDALVERVSRQPLNRDDDRLVHLVGHDAPDLFLAHRRSRAVAGRALRCAHRLGAHSFLPPEVDFLVDSLLFAVVLRPRPRTRPAGLAGTAFTACWATAFSSRPRSVITVSNRAI